MVGEGDVWVAGGDRTSESAEGGEGKFRVVVREFSRIVWARVVVLYEIEAAAVRTSNRWSDIVIH